MAISKKSKRRIRRLAYVAVLVAALGVGGHRLYKVRKAQASQTLPTVPVRKGDFAEIVRCRGEIGAGRSVQLSAPRNVPDLKILWMVEPGSRVKAGDVVVRFDPSGANRQLEEMNTVLRQSRASLDQATAQARITAEQDRLDLANAKYDVEKAKLETSKQAIVSVLQGESSKIDQATAESKLRLLEATVALHKKSDEAKTASQKRQLAKAQADVDLVKERLQMMNVKSPINGVVTFAMNRSQGWMNQQPFKVGDAVWAGAVIAEIPDPTTYRMEGKLEEVDRGRVAIGNEVQIRLDAIPEHVFKGKLAAISPLTEMSFEWPPVRSFLAYAPFDDGDSRLRSGMNGSLDTVRQHIPNAISVQTKAIFTRNGKPVVYVADGNTFKPVYIEVIARNPDEAAISGVAAGARVALTEPTLEGVSAK